jgi:hypothetical protein
MAMLNDVSGYWISAYAPYFFEIDYTLGPLPAGTNVYASIALSQVDTAPFQSESTEGFYATAYVQSWTYYLADGTESPPQGEVANFAQNAVSVINCARITFTLVVSATAAIAQINSFTF